MKTKTIFITGGVVSGLGKGITAAGLAALLKGRGFSVKAQKIDMYLNVDAGTMNPFQHGEVFVTDDGAETDLDLGHYERFIDEVMTQDSYTTMGSVYRAVTEQERDGAYLGRTIQVVPHVTDELKKRFRAGETTKPVDFRIIELGGTVGDFEGECALEAVRQFRLEEEGRTLLIHVVKMDYVFPSDEAKTKPLQHSVITLRRYGLNPDILVVRAKRPIGEEGKQKIALFCGVDSSRVIEALDAETLYDIPLSMEKHRQPHQILKLLHMPQRQPNLATLREVARRVKQTGPVVRIGLVGKYTDLSDAYISVIESTKHAGYANHAKVVVVPIDSEQLNVAQLKHIDAMIVPGGFGERGVEGKIEAIEFSRTHGVPFLGICLGLQTAVIEYARNVCGLKRANSEEFNHKTKNPVIAFLPEQAGITRKGGTMRLGAYDAKMSNSLIAKMYRWWESGSMDFDSFDEIEKLKPVAKTSERHRHRYEVNPKYHDILQKNGLVFAGMSPTGDLVEFIELPQTIHPYFVATQAHPEFKSRPCHAHPLFAGLIRAALEQKKV